ncbi:sigma-54-dependent transcriptional regulator [Desulfopila aestuarii]|uniref:Two-component system, NtrC family, response regulator n=1 Tax=Desulfopila aestuarii DSM 18488 TaxID=1121416 RepID=A0A1M7Y8W8_9BACT|nr:sigma-54 dependent transcriptional regulator [Desulfopila aestuarii]SHO49070.1 two-component system, NtrC family, response regulator [Desulfopila aestuarii DSM 18488]
MSQMLIIDDNIEACETIESLITRQSHLCDMAHTLKGGLERLNGNGYDVVFLDVHLPDGNGLEILPQIMALPNPPEVIILTGKGDPDGAELAIKGGVWDYILKPSSVREITLTLNRALKYRQEKNARTEQQSVDLSSVVGVSPGIKTSLQLTAKAARSDANVLITGETGTGKELFARTIHKNSRRAAQKFVVIDCASLTESLVESTLFGHRKGAFTGAQSDQLGLVKLADGGTLFLDEVGEMPLSLQKVFLRVLQERHFRPVGAAQEDTSNFRLIAATNRDLDMMVEQGNFRSDLLFRINTMHIRLPPLRKRIEDIKPLIVARMEYLQNNYGMAPKILADDLLTTLNSYEWPGNVRELFNILERAMVNADEDNTLYSFHLSRELRIQVAKAQIKQMTGSEVTSNEGGPANDGVRKIGHEIYKDIFDRSLPPLKEFKGMTEKIYLSELIRQCNGDISAILDKSELSRSHFYSLLKKYGLSL